MYDVKEEAGAALCRGCLSPNRRLSSLANYDLFFTLLNDKQKLEALKNPVLLFCWECTASLRRMKQFQTRAQNAHQRLEELAEELPAKGLSQLSISYKHYYDLVIEDILDCTEEPLLVHIKEEEVTKLQEDTFNDSSDKADNDSEEYNPLEMDAGIYSEEVTTENHLEKEINNTSINLRKSKRKIGILNTDAGIPAKIKKQNLKKDEKDLQKQEPLRKGSRSSGGIVTPLYHEKKDEVKAIPIKTKIKINNLTKRELKQPMNRYPFKLTSYNPSQIIIKIKKENKTPNASNIVRSDLETEATKFVETENISVNIDNTDDCVNNKTDSELNKTEKLKPIENTRQEIEIEVDNMEASFMDPIGGDSDMDDTSENDNEQKNDTESKKDDKRDKNDDSSDTDNSDPDYIEEFGKDKKKTRVRRSYKKERLHRKDAYFRSVCVKFDIIEELDKYFTHVELSPEELKGVLDNELSYVNEETPHGCKYCGACFRVSRTLMHHFHTRHKQASKCRNPVYTMYRCNICQKIVRHEHTEAHMKYLHRWKYHCNECEKDFWDTEEATSHFKDIHTGITCHLCSKVMLTKKSMERHMRVHHITVVCDLCGKRYSGRRYLENHKRIRHPVDDCRPEERYCVSCDKQFPSLYAYETHLRYALVHNQDKVVKYPCPVCAKILQTKLSLKNHYDRFHSDKTPFHCRHCDKYYARKSGLQFHVDRVHLKKELPRDKLCTICGRGFKHARTLMHHMRTHTGERPHACPHCPAAFAQPYPLVKHLATQHPAASPAPPAPQP